MTSPISTLPVFGALARSRAPCRLPGPATLDLDHERPAQERADRHERAENRDVVQARIERDRPDDVGSHQEFEAEQQRLDEVNLENVEKIGRPLLMWRRNRAVPNTTAITITATASTSIPRADRSIAMRKNASQVPSSGARASIVKCIRKSRATTPWLLGAIRADECSNDHGRP